MPITAYRTIDRLRSADFRPVANLADPNDPTAVVDAVTNFRFRLVPLTGPLPSYANIVNPFVRRVGSDLMLREDVTLEISPNCARLNTFTKIEQLLNHEQFHYDCAFVVARVVAKELSRIKAKTEAGLIAEKAKIEKHHFITRNKLIQKRYDLDSAHGLNANIQSIWKGRMDACLANANATQIGGFWL